MKSGVSFGSYEKAYNSKLKQRVKFNLGELQHRNGFAGQF